MNAEEFSKSIGDIDEKYITQMINYKPKKRIIPLYKKLTTLAAVLTLVIISAVVTLKMAAPLEIRVDGAKITAAGEVPVTPPGRGIALATENDFLDVRLNFHNARKNTSIIASEGSIYNEAGEEQGVILNDALIIWHIEKADINKTYTMAVVSQKSETELKLRFSSEEKLWVISKS